MISLLIVWFTALISTLTKIPAIIIIAICMIVLYICALLNVLFFAKWFLLVLFLLFILKQLTQYNKIKGANLLIIQKLTSYDFILYVVMSGIFFFCYLNYTLAIWDEFSHWGTIVKYLYWHQRLPVPGDPIDFLQYIPGISLFHYWMLSFSHFHENVLVFSQALVLFSILYIMVHRSAPSQFGRRCLSVALTAAFIYALNGSFTSLFIDTILGTSWACIIIYYFRFCVPTSPDENKFVDLLLAIPLLAFVVLLKASGMFLVYTSIILISLHFLVCRLRYFKKWKWKILGLLIIVSFFLTPILVKKSWDWNMSSKNITTSVYSMDFNILKSALSSEASNHDKKIVKLFWDTLFSSENAILHPVLRFFPLSVAGLLLFFLVVILIVYFQVKDVKKKKFIVYVNLFLFLFFIFYCLGMLTLYLGFSDENSLGQGSYARYITTYLYGWGFILIYFSSEFLFENATLKASRIFYVISFVLIALILALPLKYRDFYRDIRDPLRDLAIKTKTLPKDSKTWFIQQDSNGFEFWIFRYEMIPEMNIPRMSWSIGERYGTGDVWSQPKTATDWQGELSDFDYVAIGRADEKFWQQFGSLFIDPQFNKLPTVYKVLKQREGIFLKEVK